jgi:hypothetical protein
VARPADVLAAVTRLNRQLQQTEKQRALVEQFANVEATFEQARKVTDATGKLPAKAQLDKAAELAKAATKIVELMGPENVRRLTEQMRRAEAAARARNVEPRRHAPPKCGTRARASRGRTVRRRGSRRTTAPTRAGPDDGAGDPEPGPRGSGHLDRYALAGRSA